MKKNTFKKILVYTLSGILLLVIVLCVHIYMVYRPKAPTAFSRVMARIDIKQPITDADAGKIKIFMAHEKGVDHYLVNPETSIVVFTFMPIKTTGNRVVDDFKANFSFKANRFVPTTNDLKSSCPVAASSYTYKVYQFISQII
jgi:hypothetical protein